jgi:RNA polymerase sigma-70 factor (ECF subfamily)
MHAHAPLLARPPLVSPDGLAALRRSLAILLSASSQPAAGNLTRRVTASGSGRTATGPRVPRPSPSTEPNDAQAAVMALVTAAQAGDGEAFGQLFDTYVDTVHRYISYRVRDHGLAEDLTSETFLRALRRISSYTWQGRDFGAWLVTIARNLIADHFKSSRFKLELSTSDLVEAGADRSQAGPEEQVLAGITNAVLLEAVTRLKPDQQECIVLRFLQDMSVSETAVILGKNEGAVKALQYRAVKALGRLLPAELAR